VHFRLLTQPSARARCAAALVPILCVFAVGAAGAAPPAWSPPSKGPSLDIQMSTDEADAALAILAARAKGRDAPRADWERLFGSQGYVRLKEREASMGRAFDDESFRAFLLSDSMASREAALDTTVRKWKRVSAVAAARRALAYLPAGTPIRATVYLTIKPRSNSFVYDLSGDPAIFLYVDPAVPPERLANTIAHELHHVGLAAACPGEPDTTRTPARRTLDRWLGAFGEGVAVLAAAGGSRLHPELTWTREDQADWIRDMKTLDVDMWSLERFFLAIANGSLSDPDSVRAKGMTFFGKRGPWYTVGYTMASAVERAFGRERLIDSLCDPARLLIAYDAAAPILEAQYGAHFPRWSDQLMGVLRQEPGSGP